MLDDYFTLKNTMSTNNSKPFKVDFGKAALIIVDMQNDFVREGAPLEVVDARASIGRIKQLIDFFRSLRRPIVFTRFITGNKETLLWKWSPQIEAPVQCCRRGHRRFYADIGAERNCSDIIDEFQIAAGDYVVDKYWYSAFHNTNLRDILHAENADTVIVVGTVTQICVEDTTRGAFQLGYKTVLIRDCVSSFDPELHEAAIRNHGMKFGWVLNSEDLLAE
jgi:nicotinamidase-related amidase